MQHKHLAIAAVIEIARQERDTHRAVKAKSLSMALAQNPRALEVHLQTLCAQGFLTGARGPYGGYRLARDPHKITLGQLYQALLASELETDAHLDSVPGAAALIGVLAECESDRIKSMETYTVADLLALADAAVEAMRRAPAF